MSENISAVHTSTNRTSTLSNSTGTQRTKPKKWWVDELFELRGFPVDDEPGAPTKFYTTCKACSWHSKAQIVNASRLGEHAVKCKNTSSDLLYRLLQDKRLETYYRSNVSAGGSELFGHPLTPVISKKRRHTATSKKTKRKVQKCAAPPSRKPKLLLSSNTKTECSGSDMSLDSRERRSKFNDLVTRFFVKHMLPFSLLSQKEGRDEFYQIIRVANSELSEQLPDPQRMGSKNVNIYYETMHNRVKQSIAASLKESYGTLIFDGWTDMNNEGVVNVLLSFTGVEKVRKTFFLKSIFTGSITCDASFYSKIVEDSMLEFGEMQRICAVVSDNTSSCVKAKQNLLQRHNFMLSCQDQTHLANLLMQDMGKLVWINEILGMVSSVIGDLRNHPKLYHRFKELKTRFNLRTPRNRSSRELDQYGRVRLPPSAILPSKMAQTRFASSESMIASFLRCKVVLLELIECSDFHSNLYGNRNREKRDLFKATIRNEALYDKLLDVYHIFRLVRQYLRIFDDESSLLSEVYPATMQLLEKLKRLPTTPFYTAQRREEIIAVFERRKNGEGQKVALVTPLHYVAYMLDIRSLGENLGAFRPHLVQHVLSFVQSDGYPASEKVPSEGGEDVAVDRICQEFVSVRMTWRSQIQDPISRHSLLMYSQTPVYYWIEYSKTSLLREFALRILCSSPSSSSVERSFSLQGRIRTPSRNRLQQGKVSKLIFCAFNQSLFDARKRVEKKHEEIDYTNLRFGAAKEAMKTNLTEAGTNGQMYSRFLDDENISCDIVDNGDCELELDELEDWEAGFIDTSEAVEML